MEVRKEYRSKLEKLLGDGVLRDMLYEPYPITYTQEKNYLPDFVNEEKQILFEAKGYFRTSAEFRKYVDVSKCNPSWDLIFIFQDPHKPLPWAKKRQGDGKRMTHKELVEKHGFKCCTPYTVKKEWL